MEIWHKRIKELRENSDITLKDMAKIIGVSEGTVQRYESGKIKELPYKVIEAYAEKFHVLPSYIMGWTDLPDNSNYTITATANNEESVILECYRNMSSGEKDMIKRLLDYDKRLKQVKDNNSK
jgi:transcriptional regulator with XRE-family HTH domain